MAPFYGWFNCLKATATSRRQFAFYHSVPRNSWYSFYRPQKDERLSWPWSHPVVLNTGPQDWESSALTTRPNNVLNITDRKLNKIELNVNTARKQTCISPKKSSAVILIFVIELSVWTGNHMYEKESNIYS